MVSSIRGFAQELGSTYVIKSHVEKQRSHTLRRTATTDFEFEQLKAHGLAKLHRKKPPPISEPCNLEKRTVDFDMEKRVAPASSQTRQQPSKGGPVNASLRVLKGVGSRQPKIFLMKQEKDRFDAMRRIQHETHKFKRYYALTMSIIACKCSSHTLILAGVSQRPCRLFFMSARRLISCSWTPLVRRRCRLLGSGIEVSRSELFSGSLLLLRLPSHHRLWRPESQKQRRETIVYCLVPDRRPNHDYTDF